MSAICSNFTQNAWKKELCSNCFKSKDEHTFTKPKPITPTNKSVESIIKRHHNGKLKRTVCFPAELSEVIGYGGEDWSSDPEDDPQEIEEDAMDVDEIGVDGEDDRELLRVTKANTDFNTSCLDFKEKKSNAPLMLGKPLVDSDGKKQTLKVSVVPFGQERKKEVGKGGSQIPVKSKEVADVINKSSVVLTGFKSEKSLLDEISETLEKSRNPIRIMSKSEVEDKDSDKENNKVVIEEVKPEKKNGLSRAVVIKRDEKPIVFQTTTAKIELFNAKNSMLNKEVTSKFIKSERIFVKKTEPLPDKKPEEPIKDISIEHQTNKELQETEESNSSYPSREQVGEPDGKADTDGEEPPALPLTPPPQLELQSSFLHPTQQSYEKPKLPLKPVAMRKPQAPTRQPEVEAQNIAGDSEAKSKRRAPKPPPEETGLLFTRNSTCNVNSDSPVVREKEKRERAASCSPKGNFEAEATYVAIPEPLPRKTLSLSTDSLASDDKRKAKQRFSLKKFLRIGNNKDVKILDGYKTVDTTDGAPQPKPRLVIVHPLDLNGAQVQIVSKSNNENVEYSVPNNICTTECSLKNAKPPPPPRNMDSLHGRTVKALPTPPKSAEILIRQKQFLKATPVKKVDSVYANIGEVRNAITPHKPQRTASMREREEKQRKENSLAYNGNQENVYDYINCRSSSPEYDSCNGKDSPPVVKQNTLTKQRSESTVDVSGEYFKYQNIPRSMSLTYCGSETESEIYSPFSCCGSESEVTEDDHDWMTPNGRTYKLRSRKGRSIVHKNLEDNYGAVVVANHEALAQVLENIQHSSPIQPALRGLKTALNLRWSDFSIKSSSIPTFIGTRAFHQALWNTQNVTLVINSSPVPSSSLSLGSFSLTPLAEFSDLVPTKYLPGVGDDENQKHMQASVAVLPWLQVNTLQGYGDVLRGKNATPEEAWKEGAFVMLQLVNALKTLQAQGIEELPASLISFVLCKEADKDASQKLYVLQSLGEDLTSNSNPTEAATLCKCALKATSELLPDNRHTQLLRALLKTERAVSLTQVKSVLEFLLWGPSDVSLSGSIRERELALQRWLDLQRATVLHGLVYARVHLTVQEECHLLFLVRSNAKMVCDASLLLESCGK